MLRKLRKLFTKGQCFLVVNVSNRDVALRALDDLPLAMNAPLFIYDLQRALINFENLVGERKAGFLAWEIATIADLGKHARVFSHLKMLFWQARLALCVATTCSTRG